MKDVRYPVVGTAALLIAACTTQLGTLGGSSIANDINAAGTAVGRAELSASSESWHAVLYPAEGGIRDLGALHGDTDSTATSIADDGTVVGYSGVPSPFTTLTNSADCRAVLWNAAGQIQDLGQLAPGLATQATAINNAGVVVGFAATPDVVLSERAWFRQPSSTAFQELPLPPNALSAMANAINDAGEVAGNVTVDQSGALRAVRWDIGSRAVVHLTPPDAEFTEAFGINALGTVVGATRSPGAYRATVWPKGALPIYLSSGAFPVARARAINADGVVVGELVQPTPPRAYSRAARWDPVAGGGYSEPVLINTYEQPSSTPLPHTSSALAINDRRVAVGFADGFAVRFDP